MPRPVSSWWIDRTGHNKGVSMVQLLQAPAQTGGSADQQVQTKNPRPTQPGAIRDVHPIDGKAGSSWDSIDAWAERQAEAASWLEENTPQPMARPRNTVYVAEQLTSVLRPD